MSGPPFLCQDPLLPYPLYIRTQFALTQDHFVCQDVLELGAAVKIPSPVNATGQAVVRNAVRARDRLRRQPYLRIPFWLQFTISTKPRVWFVHGT